MLKRLINTGVLADMPEMQARKTRIVNLAALLTGGLLCLFVVVMLVRSLWTNAVIYSLLALTGFFTFYINGRHRHMLARLYMLGIIAFILICMEFLMRGPSKYIFLACLMLLGVFLAESRRESLFIFLGSMLIYLIHYFTPRFLEMENIPHESAVGRWINLTVGSATLAMVIELFKTDGRRYEQLLSESNTQLEQKRAEADMQRATTVRQAQKLAARNAEAVVVNRDIQDSIRYAKRIQDSLIPTKEQLRTHFPDVLVFFKPKDLLSGDFYWFTEVDGHQFLAVADCTGHGVPGAMMTVLGNNLLNQIVGRDGLRGPGAILSELDRQVTDLLGHRDKTDEEASDGMDIALVRIDRSGRSLTFSSARRPLFFFHGTGSELTEYRPSRFSIGGLGGDRQFSEQEVSFSDGDVFYLSTDGFVDQFGPDGKYQPKRFRQLLREMHRKPMAEQHRLLNETFLRWKVTEPQTDDILLLGVKL